MTEDEDGPNDEVPSSGDEAREPTPYFEVPYQPGAKDAYALRSLSSGTVPSIPTTDDEWAKAAWFEAYSAVLGAISRMARGVTSPDDLVRVARALSILPNPRAVSPWELHWDADAAANDDRDDDDQDEDDLGQGR